MVQPVSVVQAEGMDAVFECLYRDAITHGWKINGTFPADALFPTDLTRTSASSKTPATLTIPATAHYNNTVVQCIAVVEEETPVFKRTENATLTIFGRSFVYTCMYIPMPLTVYSCRNLLLQPLLLIKIMIRI